MNLIKWICFGIWRKMKFVNDCDVWASCPTDWLWVYDKLIVAECTKILADNGEFRGCVIIGKHFGVEE